MQARDIGIRIQGYQQGTRAKRVYITNIHPQYDNTKGRESTYPLVMKPFQV